MQFSAFPWLLPSNAMLFFSRFGLLVFLVLNAAKRHKTYLNGDEPTNKCLKFTLECLNLANDVANILKKNFQICVRGRARAQSCSLNATPIETSVA